jgi:hypothetical protein
VDLRSWDLDLKFLTFTNLDWGEVLEIWSGVAGRKSSYSSKTGISWMVGTFLIGRVRCGSGRGMGAKAGLLHGIELSAAEA